MKGEWEEREREGEEEGEWDSWLTVFTYQSQRADGMLIRVATVHKYTYGHIYNCVYTVQTVHTACVHNLREECEPTPLPG